jgi:hypothetical protein
MVRADFLFRPDRKPFYFCKMKNSLELHRLPRLPACISRGQATALSRNPPHAIGVLLSGAWPSANGARHREHQELNLSLSMGESRGHSWNRRKAK